MEEVVTSFVSKRDNLAAKPAPARVRAPGFALVIWLGLFSYVFLLAAHPLTIRNTELKPSLHEGKVIRATLEQLKLQTTPQTSPHAGGYAHWAPHATVETVPPLYPWLMAHWLGTLPINEAGQEIISTQDLYTRGLCLNVWLGLIFLLIMGTWIWARGSLLVAANAMLVLGFGVVLPQAMFYEPNVLSYGWYGMAFVLALELLTRNLAWTHVLFGLVVGAAYLTDLTVLPLVAIWALVTVGRFLYELFRRDADQGWSCPGQFIGLLGFTFALCAVIGPNLLFHNAHGTPGLHSSSSS
jgi:hypothetical protein